MKEDVYYQTSSVFKKIGNELKKISESQNTLSDVNMMLKSVTLSTLIISTNSLEKIKFASNNDLFLIGRNKPSYLKIKINVTIKNKG